MDPPDSRALTGLGARGIRSAKAAERVVNEDESADASGPALGFAATPFRRHEGFSVPFAELRDGKGNGPGPGRLVSNGGLGIDPRLGIGPGQAL
jgi:hypothetical protein